MQDQGTARRRCAIWRRVSTSQQDAESQDVLRQWAADRGLEVTAEFTVEDTAWKTRNGKGGEYDRTRAELLNGARLGRYEVVLIWALDRLSRKGIKDTIGVLEQFGGYGCDVWSYQESWLTTAGEARDLIIAVMAWIAQKESERRSERMKLSIEKRKKDGRPIGRGSAPDSKPRKRSGYVAAWEEGGARREAEEQRKAAAR